MARALTYAGNFRRMSTNSGTAAAAIANVEFCGYNSELAHTVKVNLLILHD